LLDPHEQKMYKDFTKNLILTTPDDVEIEAENATSLWQKLMQFASGAVYDDNGEFHPVHDHKLEELMELRAEAQGSPLLIAYWHRSSLARLRKLLPKAVVMDREAKCVDPWNAGKIRDLLIHPRSAGHGLNMQYGPGHTLVFFDNPSPLEDYEQLIKRIARPGQKKPVKVYHLTTRGTIDEVVVPNLREKKSAETAVRKYIRDLRIEFGAK
jgi:SNF2 family DNA or RNA helicase